VFPCYCVVYMILFHFAHCCMARLSFFKHMTSSGNEATSSGLLQCQLTSEIRDYKQKHDLRSTYRRQATYSRVPGISVCRLYKSIRNTKHLEIASRGQYK
jgi:hypothetical protein